ncbi:MAG: diguanylate cyclase [Solirubrobacteraceae bacterium]
MPIQTALNTDTPAFERDDRRAGGSAPTGGPSPRKLREIPVGEREAGHPTMLAAEENDTERRRAPTPGGFDWGRPSISDAKRPGQAPLLELTGRDPPPPIRDTPATDELSHIRWTSCSLSPRTMTAPARPSHGRDIDQAIQQLGAALEGDSILVVANAFAQLSTVLAELADAQAQTHSARDYPSLDQTGEARDRTAEDRDERAEVHDQVSESRDRKADARDVRAEARERDGVVSGAREDRAAALRDRQRGSSDRSAAADDRAGASVDRAAAAEDRATSGIDDLTGAYRRLLGMAGLERDLARAKRTQQPFALVFVDVDGLKAINDSRGHSAGDQLLRATVESIRAHLRSYDLIVRFGGDEFLCGLADVTVADAAKRFSLVNADLAETQQASVTVGVAQLEADDALGELIVRADQALYRNAGRDRLELDLAVDERPRTKGEIARPVPRAVPTGTARR